MLSKDDEDKILLIQLSNLKHTDRHIHIHPYIYHNHLITPSARISLTLSRHPSLSSIASDRFSGLHPVSAQSCWCRFELVVQPLLGHVKRSTGHITYELTPTSPAVSRMSVSSNFDSFLDEW